jgi:hypothetical protein
MQLCWVDKNINENITSLGLTLRQTMNLTKLITEEMEIIYSYFLPPNGWLRERMMMMMVMMYHSYDDGTIEVSI